MTGSEGTRSTDLIAYPLGWRLAANAVTILNQVTPKLINQ